MDRGGRLQVRERGGDRRSGSEARLPALPGPPPLPRVPRPRPSGRPRQGRHRVVGAGSRGEASSPSIAAGVPFEHDPDEGTDAPATTGISTIRGADAPRGVVRERRNTRDSSGHDAGTRLIGRLEQSWQTRQFRCSPVPSRLLSRLFASRSRYLPPAVPAARGTSRGALDDVADDVSRAWSPFSRIPPPLSRSFARARATLPASRRI